VRFSKVSFGILEMLRALVVQGRQVQGAVAGATACCGFHFCFCSSFPGCHRASGGLSGERLVGTVGAYQYGLGD
jgi:hypothetical protein